MDRDSNRRDDLEALVAIRRRLATSDPDVLRAVEEVDRSLIRSQLARSPMARLQTGIAFAQSLSRFHRADDIRD